MAFGRRKINGEEALSGDETALKRMRMLRSLDQQQY